MRVAVLIAAASAAALAAQAPTFRAKVETVAVYATVHGPDGQYLPGLTADDFELLDNGKRQPIAVFSGDIQPTTIALLLDRSGSLSNRMTAVATAARAFVGDLLPADRASVGSLNFDCQNMTSDKGALTRALAGQMQVDQGSPIWAASDRVMWSLDREPGRRAMLLFSDGDDTGARVLSQKQLAAVPGSCRPSDQNVDVTLDELSHHATGEGLLFYTVSVETGQTVNETDLRWLAQRSGAASYTLKSDSDLTPAFKSIVDELHHQYLLGFVPAVFDGRVHTLDVKVKRPGAKIRARKTYIAEHASDDTGSLGLRARAHPETPEPAAPEEVELAIKRGAEGLKLQATCSTSISTSAYGVADVVRVVAEGPIGRIMRAAREAKTHDAVFAFTGVTPEMQSTSLTVTIDAARIPETVRLRDRAPYPRTLLPASMSAPQHRMAGAPARVATFDMAAFNNLVGPTIEVLMSFNIDTVEAKCSLAEADVLAIR